MAAVHHPGREARTALQYSLVAAVGFAIDAVLLKGLIALGMEPAWARVISLFAAMQATFLINGLWVFRCLKSENLGSSWLGYMTTNGFGNFCNYWVFVSLISLHRPLWSNALLDVAIGGGVAWLINYACLRLLVFRRPVDNCTPIGEVGGLVMASARGAVSALQEPPPATVRPTGLGT